jgi:hypothetical protein
MSFGWKCPNCGKAHGPHVQTCPEPAATRVIGIPLTETGMPFIPPNPMLPTVRPVLPTTMPFSTDPRICTSVVMKVGH